MASRIREYFERQSNFLRSITKINIFGIYQPQLPSWMDSNLTPQEQDYLAIKRDWEKVGSDLEKAMKDTKINQK